MRVLMMDEQTAISLEKALVAQTRLLINRLSVGDLHREDLGYIDEMREIVFTLRDMSNRIDIDSDDGDNRGDYEGDYGSTR